MTEASFRRRAGNVYKKRFRIYKLFVATWPKSVSAASADAAAEMGSAA
jgi:hypothetical protein